jgi:hypothetical protein
MLGVKLHMSTRDHPQSDGQTKNAHGILEDTLRHFVGPYQRDWDQHLTVVDFAMNNSYHSGMRKTPFMLNYGQHPMEPALAGLRHKNPAVSKFLGNWEEQVSKAKTFLEIKPRDQVLVKTKFFQLTSGVSGNLAPRWLGPFTVTEVLHPHKLAVRLDLHSRAKLMHPVFHVLNLRPYHTSRNYQPPQLPDSIDGRWNGRLITLKSAKVLGTVCNILCIGVAILTPLLIGNLLLIWAMLLIKCLSSGKLRVNPVLMLSPSPILLRDQLFSDGFFVSYTSKRSAIPNSCLLLLSLMSLKDRL